MSSSEDNLAVWRRAAARSAMLSAAFCAVVLSLLIANTLRSKFQDPLLPDRLQARILDLNRRPSDEKLRMEVRRQDRELRTAYVRDRAFAGRGFYLLIGGLVTFLLSLEWGAALTRALPVPRREAASEAWQDRAVGRVTVASLGTLLAGVLLVLAVISRHDAAAEYARAADREFRDSVRLASRTGADAGATQPALPKPAEASPPAAAQPPTNAGTPTSPSAPSGTSSFASAGASAKPATSPLIATPKAKTAPRMALAGAPHPAGWESNWPIFRGPAGIGTASAAEPPTEWDAGSGKGIAWRAEVPLPGNSSPVVWGERLFLTGADKSARAVYCFDALKGGLLWKREVPVQSSEHPLKIFEGTGFASPTMAVDGKSAFAIFPNGDVVALDFAGKRLWMKRLGPLDNTYGHAASLTLYGTGVIVQLDQGSEGKGAGSKLVALDKAAGEIVWQVERQLPSSWSTPVLVRAGKRDELVTCANPWVIAYDPKNGSELWRANCLKGDVVSSAAVGGGYVLASSQGAALAAIRPGGSGDVTKAGIAWKYEDELPDIASPASTGELVFFATSDGLVTCLDAANGKKVWEHAYREGFHSSPIVAGNRIYLQDQNGTMRILAAAREFKELGSGTTGEKVETTPAILNGRIYIRGAKRLFCIGNAGGG